MPSQNGKTGRNKNGKFAKGNPGGPGNPFLKHVNKFRKALYKCVTEKDFIELVKGQMEKAKSDPNAARLMLGYLIGNPEQTFNLTGEQAVTVQIVNKVMEGVDNSS